MRLTEVFLNVVKDFSMQILAFRDLITRGDHISVVPSNEHCGKSLMAVLWMDRECRYFLSNCHTTDEGTPIRRDRWRNIDGQHTKM